jgi:hypothetical protein
MGHLLTLAFSTMAFKINREDEGSYIDITTIALFGLKYSQEFKW